MRRWLSTTLLLSCVLAGGFWNAAILAAEESAAAESVRIAWEFNSDGDLQGWEPSGQIAEPVVAGGLLRGRTTDNDPIIVGPTFEIPARATQRVEIRMKTDATSAPQLFWTETLRGPYGGFSQEKCNVFDVISDGQFHVYRIYPFWQAAGKIVRLRFDPPSEGPFEIDWIRIIEGPASAPTNARTWQFASAAQDWWPMQEMTAPVIRNGALELTTQGTESILGSPTLAIPSPDAGVVAVRMAVSEGLSGSVHFSTSKHVGWRSMSFPLRPDGKMHTYNIELPELFDSADQLVFLGISPSDVAGANVRLESVAVSNEPAGPADMTVRYFGPEEGVNRLGRPATVLCTINNYGGEPAQGATATLTVPEGAKLVGDARQPLPAVTCNFNETMRWSLQGSAAGPVPLSVKIEAPGAEPISVTSTIEFTPAPEVAKTGEVPEPRPVPSKFDIGAFYFPGWPVTAKWEPIRDFPARKPVLGWYDEANPQCIDWQIKWASEHGIKFFLVDWYWCKGGRYLEHWVQSFEKAKHRKYLQWCVMWANHNAPGSHSAEDWRQVTQYWIDHCFNLPEYYRIDGRPAVFIWAPSNIRDDLGGPEKAAELYAMSQKMARDAGYPGIYFAAMGSPTPSKTTSQTLKQEGYEGFTSYHTFQLAHARIKKQQFPYVEVVKSSPEVWQKADAAASGLQYFPLLDSGWADEPWHGRKGMTLTERTPELMGELCRLGRKYAEEHQKKTLILGPLNEWGEGSYFEPCTEYGFRCLDEIRAAFCEPGDYPPNLIPSDVGLGPYDLAWDAPKTAWNFAEEGKLQGWSPNSTLQATVQGGVLQAKSTGGDPILSGPRLRLPAASLRHLTIRMKCSANDHGQVFWSTRFTPTREANSVHFEVIGDGQFHDYELDLGANPQWRGMITSLRIDPVGGSNRELAIESIRLHE